MQSNQKLLQLVLNIFRERSTYMYFEFWGLLPQERTVNLHKWKFSQRDNLPIFDEETLIGKYLAKSHMFYHSAWLFRVGKKLNAAPCVLFCRKTKIILIKRSCVEHRQDLVGIHYFVTKNKTCFLMKLFSADWIAGKVVIFWNSLCLYGFVTQVYGYTGLGFVYLVITLNLLRLACGRTVKS